MNTDRIDPREITEAEPPAPERQLPAERPEAKDGQVIPFDPLGGRMPMFTNLDTSRRSGRVQVMKCYGNPTLKVGDSLNKELALCGVLIHPVMMVDKETGEERQLLRSVLVVNGGDTLAFVSDGIVKGINLLVMVEGRGPWEPPLPIRIKQVDTRLGNRTYNIELLDEPPPPVRKGGR